MPLCAEEIDPLQQEASALLHRLRRDPLIRQVLSLQKTRHSLPDDTCDALIATLIKPSEALWRHRLVAIWALERAELRPGQTAAAAEALCIALENRQVSAAVRLRRRFGRAFVCTALWVGAALFCSLVLAVLSIFIMESDSGTLGLLLAGSYVPVIGALLVTPLVFPLSCLTDWVHTADVREAAARTLGILGVPESVGALSGALSDSCCAVSRAAEAALPPALHSLTAEHYGRLRADTVPNLCRVVQRGPAPMRLALDLLAALEHVGDGRAVAPIQSVAMRGASPRLREAAARILPTLLKRQKQENEREMLLRGATMPDAAPDILLRPATANAPDTAPELLLRASGAAGEEAC
jgi:hypothetical protein